MKLKKLLALALAGVLMLALPWVTSMGSLLKTKKQAGALCFLSASRIAAVQPFS